MRSLAPMMGHESTIDGAIKYAYFLAITNLSGDFLS